MENIPREEALSLLNAKDRLENLSALVEKARRGQLPLPETRSDVNNHIHTTYSFSPYSPAAAVWFAWQAGLCTCGLMDHDSIGGAEEFLKACRIVGLHGTIGLECRASMAGTPYAEKRLNNPDQPGAAYITLHAVPHDQAEALNKYYAPCREKRNIRNRKMTESVNRLLGAYGVSLDFDRDVLPLSNAGVGGTVTERHISYALAKKLLSAFESRSALVSFLRDAMALKLSKKVEGLLLDGKNPFAEYDLLGFIKAELIAKFYIPADDELLNVREILSHAAEIGAIASYAYLGDVGESVTGDKRAQTFEDSFLDELVPYLKDLGFQAISYMPSRNTPSQLDRLRALCDRYELFQISGEDINQPRQKFVCEAQRGEKFINLYHSAWAMIASERLSIGHLENGLFSAQTAARLPNLNDRVAAFSQIGQTLAP